MKRLLVVAKDRDLTRFVAEALLGRALDRASGAGPSGPRPNDPWDISRAHSGLEAHLLVTRGGRPFDLILIDQPLPDQEVVALLDNLRNFEGSAEVPIFLLSERGRAPHSRRIATERYKVTGFIEKPVTAQSLRDALGTLERKRRVLLVESNIDQAQRYKELMMRSGYLAEVAEKAREALARVPRLRPDVVVSALLLSDMRGVELCVELKKQHRQEGLPVVLYGQLNQLGNHEITENAHRADDFVQAPFDDELLIERVASLIGVGPRRRRRRSILASIDPSTDNTISDPMPPVKKPRSGSVKSTPPASASPAPLAPSRRSTRRVPCNLEAKVRDGDQVYTSKTLDISHGGIFIATDINFEIGTLLDLSFQIPDAERTLEAVGRVTWVRTRGASDEPAGVGLKFSQIDPEDLKLIVGYVNRVSRLLFNAD